MDEHRGEPAEAAGLDARGTWDQLEVLLTNCRRIEAWSGQPGPFIRSVTRAGTPRQIPLA